MSFAHVVRAISKKKRERKLNKKLKKEKGNQKPPSVLSFFNSKGLRKRIFETGVYHSEMPKFDYKEWLI